ncbi:MAG: hypothetical protein Kow00105_16300 [Phycisphaeraceae bacterium]
MTQRATQPEGMQPAQRWGGGVHPAVLEALEPRLLLSASPVAASGDEVAAAMTLSQDISVVPLLDGETTSSGNNLVNRFGGQTNLAFNATVAHTTDPALVGTGDGALEMNVTVPAGQFGFFITVLGGIEPSNQYTDARDITTFDMVRFDVRNRTGEAFNLRFEIKDYRDSNFHRASWNTPIGAADQWTRVEVPLDLSTPGWVIQGNPDLERARQFALLVEAGPGQAINGQLIFDDMVLIEPGGALDPATAPLEDLVQRLARRQFDALWGSRDPDTGAVETLSSFGRLLSMNTTGSLIKMLPGAIDRGWVTRAEADAFVQATVNTLNSTMDNTIAAGDGGFLPPRYIDRATFTSAAPYEESSIDSAFMFLALYQYKSQAGTSAGLRANIETLLDRFNFAAFSSFNGWRMAWFNNTHTFTNATYDGYGGENWVISLAAHLAQVNHVDITTHYNANVFRTKAHLIDPAREHLVHTFTQFRPPFVQWLFDLFVDTNDRGKDTYPDPAMASNPFDNAVRYQKEVDAYFAQQGRGFFLQPDAGSSGSQYQQFSAYNNFGEPDVYMPWAVSFSLLGDPQAAEPALRNTLIHNMHGPFGLSDSAHWTTGAVEPDSFPAINDLWNTSLSTMALLEFLYDDNQFFTDLPEVKAALDAVFPQVIIDGDLNKDGFVGIDDLNIVLGNWNQAVGPGDFFSGDVSSDGFVGIDDLNTVLSNWNAVAPASMSAETVTMDAVTANSSEAVAPVTNSDSSFNRTGHGSAKQQAAEARVEAGLDRQQVMLAAIWQRAGERHAGGRTHPGLLWHDGGDDAEPTLGLWEIGGRPLDDTSVSSW